jgi:phosphatidylinositol alpha-mannosyltransferase
MRIALTNPTCWPEVRRGSERHLHDHARYHAALGHEVTVISTHSGPREDRREDGVRHILLPRRLPLGRPNRWLGAFHAFAFQVRDEVRAAAAQGRGFDVVHCLNYHDAFGVLLAGPGRPRLVYHLAGIPLRAYFRRIPHDGWMFRRVLRQAEACAVVSHHAQVMLRQEFGMEGVLLPAPCDLAPLYATPKPPPDGQLRLLFAADADEPRKGAALLARAFAQVRAARPEARLVYAGPASAATQGAVLAAAAEADRPHIAFTGVGAPGDLAARYAGADLLVHPAVWEAQGMVLVEALAAGTPVVACNHAGIADIVTDPAIGRLFEPGPIRGHAATDHAALAAAILDAAVLAATPGTAARCRAHAAPFGWDRLGPRYAAVLAGNVPISQDSDAGPTRAGEPCGMGTGNEPISPRPDA